MRLGRLLLRITVGAFFVGHGTQKLFGSFGGNGLAATADAFDGMGLKPGKAHASAAGAAETLGGAGLLLGYQTPIAAAAIVGTMATAIDRVHLKNGPWAQDGGYEYNAVLIAAAATLAETGPGSLSLDALRGKEKVGAKWSLFAIVAGLAGAAAVRAAGDLQAGRAAPEFPPSEPAPAAPSAAEIHEPVAAAAEPVADETPVEAPVEDSPAPDAVTDEA